MRLNSAATESGTRTRTSGGLRPAANESLEADAVILATPAFRTGEMLSDVAASAAEELKQISYASTATVSLAYRREDFPRPPNSFGFVVPAIERRKIMACTFSSLKYPGRAPEDKVLLRAFVGGSLQPELFQDDDATMEKQRPRRTGELARRHRRTDILAHLAPPEFHAAISCRPSSADSANRSGIAKFPTLALAGSAYHGVGISDCVRTGEEAAEKIVDHVLV